MFPSNASSSSTSEPLLERALRGQMLSLSSSCAEGAVRHGPGCYAALSFVTLPKHYSTMLLKAVRGVDLEGSHLPGLGM